MADFGPAGPHPVIVVSREELNRGRYALAIVCTSARFAVRSKLSNCVPFQAGDFGFTVDFRVHRRLCGTVREHPFHRSGAARLTNGTDGDLG
jgi:mRNA-degrading endonuclease toxin of MazEF toxin-antitoxin module